MKIGKEEWLVRMNKSLSLFLLSLVVASVNQRVMYSFHLILNPLIVIKAQQASRCAGRGRFLATRLLACNGSMP